MTSLLLARGRALSGCACVAAALAVAGCTGTAASNSGSSVAGNTLTIYASKPPGALTPQQQDVLSAEQLALHQIGDQIGKFTIHLVETGGSNELSANARGAIADLTTIAYLGELEPGTSGQTIGITNAESVLQVSPTDGALELTQSVPEVPGSPDLYYESLSANGRTFARVVPNDRLEAKALVTEMQTLGVTRVYVSTDRSDYARVLTGLLGGDGIAVTSSATGAQAMLYAGSSPTAAATAFNAAVSSNPSMKLFATSDVAVSSLSAGASSNLYVISPGFMKSDLPSQGSQFVAAFKAAEGHDPAPEAIFGYEAMASVLAALRRAGGSANARNTVVHDLLGVTRNAGWPQSAIGSYSINKNGDISYPNGAPFVFSRVKAGALVPFKAVQQQG